MSARIGQLIAGLALCLAGLTGCAEDEAQDAIDQAREEASSAAEDADLPDIDLPSTDLPDVDLPDLDVEGYSEEFQDRVAELAENADCDGLRDELDKLDGNDSEIARVLEEQLEQLDC